MPQKNKMILAKKVLIKTKIYAMRRFYLLQVFPVKGASFTDL